MRDEFGTAATCAIGTKSPHDQASVGRDRRVDRLRGRCHEQHMKRLCWPFFFCVTHRRKLIEKHFQALNSCSPQSSKRFHRYDTASAISTTNSQGENRSRCSDAVGIVNSVPKHGSSQGTTPTDEKNEELTHLKAENCLHFPFFSWLLQENTQSPPATHQAHSSKQRESAQIQGMCNLILEGGGEAGRTGQNRS